MQPKSDDQKSRIIGPRSVSKRGGSLQVTIPPEISHHLGVQEGDRIVYIIDQETGHVTFARADKIEIMLSKLGRPATLGFALPKDLIKTITGKGAHGRRGNSQGVRVR